MRHRIGLLLLVVALVSAACGGDGDTDTAAPTATEEMEAAGATVAVSSSDLGDILTDGDGNTLYLFMPDGQGEPTCVDDCAANWPVFEGPASAGEGADDSLLGTVEHPSGATQVTYNDWPLYYFANDEAAGDTNGQGLNDVWFVVDPAGEPVSQ